MQFGSVCSGIEAASVAFHPLGWSAAWLAEIEPFPNAVLAHHYPEVPNLGDMTAIARRVLTGEVAAPDLLCGGTPCQAFSVAGLRESLADARGNLTLKFVELADAIDHVRGRAGKPASIVLWENVPGVLSTKDNAFGCFLAELAGEDDPLVPPGGKWANSGAVYGPRRAVAWRTLDAQYFGLAQRRRRVFVVASAREGFDPASVLFEWDSLRRDTAPSREAGEETAATLDARAEGGGFPGTDGACGGHVQPVAFGGNKTSGPRDVASALSALSAHGGTGRHDFETETFVTHSLRGEGFDASEDGTGRGTPLVPVAFDTTQITSATNRSNPQPGDPCHPLAAGAHAPAIAFPARLSGTQCASTENLAPSMGAKNPTAVAVGADCFNGSLTGDVAATMGTRGSSVSASGPTVMQAMQVRRLTPRECERLQGFPDDYTLIPWRGKFKCGHCGETFADKHAGGIGGLAPAECPKCGEEGDIAPECPDGPRYKALGNSWAVPCAAWIGRRINDALRRAA
jgi:DNA (cytosine-5)-methyltransferase 1